jgi:photosystem II stability/assembly factor-like uncharacterized protein
MKSVCCALLVIASFAINAPIFAQSPFWEATAGPEGGLIPAVTIDSLQRVLSGTATGGIFMSADDGASWFPVNNKIGTPHIKYLESSLNGYVFAMTFTNGMYRYQVSDANYEWVHLDSMTYGNSVDGFVIDHAGDLFVSVYKQGIARSLDNGQHWLASSPAIKDSTMNAMAVDEAGNILCITTFGSMYRTTDHGTTWIKLNPSPNGKDATAITSSLDGGILVADQWGVIYRSRDHAASWQKVYTEPAIKAWFSMITDRSNGHLFARNSAGALYRSDDAGSSWNKIDSSITDGDFFPMAIKKNNHLFLGTDFFGMYRSTDDGMTWSLGNKGLWAYQIVGIASNSKGDIFALSERLVFRTTDRGDHWQRLDIDLGQNFANDPIAIDQLDNVFIGTEQGVLRSSDQGNSWKYVDSIPKNQSTNLVSSLVVNPAGHIFVATQFGTDISIDHGATWSKVSGDPGLSACDRLALGANGQVYASLVTGAIYASNDLGKHWQAIGTHAGLRVVLTDGTMFAVSQGLFRSKDTAQNWEEIKPFPLRPKAVVYDIVLTSKGELLLATDSGAFRSPNGGDTWIDVSRGLNQASFTPLLGTSTYCENPQGLFYAATRGQGVYRSLNTLGVSERLAQPHDFSLSQNYPNPFNPSTLISLTMPQTGPLRLEVFDVLGRKISTLVSGNQQAGVHEFRFDGSNYASGAYFYRATIAAKSVGKWMLLVK